jgi:hypothetical protein
VLPGAVELVGLGQDVLSAVEFVKSTAFVFMVGAFVVVRAFIAGGRCS